MPRFTPLPISGNTTKRMDIFHPKEESEMNKGRRIGRTGREGGGGRNVVDVYWSTKKSEQPEDTRKAAMSSCT